MQTGAPGKCSPKQYLEKTYNTAQSSLFLQNTIVRSAYFLSNKSLSTSGLKEESSDSNFFTDKAILVFSGDTSTTTGFCIPRILSMDKQ